MLGPLWVRGYVGLWLDEELDGSAAAALGAEVRPKQCITSIAVLQAICCLGRAW